MITISPSLMFALLLNLSSGLFADMGFGLQSDVTPRFRFENLTDYPEYDFYLKYGHAANPQAVGYLTKIPPGVSFSLEGSGSRMTDVTLVALPAGLSPPAKADHTYTDVKDLLSFVPKSEGRVLETGPLGWEDARVVVYRVGIADKQLSATRVKTEHEWGVWSLGDLCCVVLAGVAASVAFVVFGLWRVLRGRKKKTA